jgi:hypothetical protein
VNNNPTAAQILSAPLSLVLLGVALSMFHVSALGQSPVPLGASNFVDEAKATT